MGNGLKLEKWGVRSGRAVEAVEAVEGCKVEGYKGCRAVGCMGEGVIRGSDFFYLLSSNPLQSSTTLHSLYSRRNGVFCFTHPPSTHPLIHPIAQHLTTAPLSPQPLIYTSPIVSGRLTSSTVYGIEGSFI